MAQATTEIIKIIKKAKGFFFFFFSYVIIKILDQIQVVGFRTEITLIDCNDAVMLVPSVN